ncbi:MAG: glycosyltransferase family 2 protein [Campylobacterota bacterium]
MIENISVVIMAKDAQETIAESLDSLVDFKEVVLYLNNSTDNTQKIAEKYSNVKIVQGEFIGFGPTKNAAATHASNDWILSLDSDEILNDKLIKEILSQDLDNPNNLFILVRDNYFLGEKTISKDYIVRLYNREKNLFDDALVHEKVQVHNYNNKITLKTTFKHLNITDINQTLHKMIKYTDLGAEGKKTCFFGVVIAKAFFAFFQTYILRFYFVNGWVGFTIAVSNANRRFYKYLKQYINCKNSS